MVRGVEAAEGAAPARPAVMPAAAPPRAAFEPVRLRPSPQPVLTALPADTPRSRVAELGGSMMLTVLFALLGAVLWSTATGRSRSPVELGNLFFLTVAASWAVLVPAKFWTSKRGNPWARRVVMLVLGALVGVQAYWLDGGSVRVLPPFAPAATAASEVGDRVSFPGRALLHAGGEASYLSYYALAFFALRWWRMTDRRRTARFSFAPLLGAAFWGLVLTLVGPDWTARGTGMLVLVMTSAVVQMVSPWDQPPPPAAKRIRLRCA
jgi:hypothetical protein